MSTKYYGPMWTAGRIAVDVESYDGRIAVCVESYAGRVAVDVESYAGEYRGRCVES